MFYKSNETPESQLDFYYKTERNDESTDFAFDLEQIIMALSDLDATPEILISSSLFIQTIPYMHCLNPIAILQPKFNSVINISDKAVEWINLFHVLVQRYPECLDKEIIENIFNVAMQSPSGFDAVNRLLALFCSKMPSRIIDEFISIEQIDLMVDVFIDHPDEIDIKALSQLLGFFVSYTDPLKRFIEETMNSTFGKSGSFFHFLNRIITSGAYLSDYIEIHNVLNNVRYIKNKEIGLFLNFLISLIQARNQKVNLVQFKFIPKLLLRAKPFNKITTGFPHDIFLMFCVEYINTQTIETLNNDVDLLFIDYIDTFFHENDVRLLILGCNVLGCLVRKFFDYYEESSFEIPLSHFALSVLRRLCLTGDDDLTMNTLLALCYLMFSISDDTEDFAFIDNEIFDEEFLYYLSEIEDTSISYTASMTILTNVDELIERYRK